MRYENIVVSPHIDDATFSLGGLLYENKKKPQKIADIFSQTPSRAKRKKEEMVVAKKLGAKVDFLDFKDELHWKVTLMDEKFKERMKQKLRRYLKEGNRVFFPLGIGGHSDHLILSKIGLELAKETGNRNVYFYEDLPYAVKTLRIYPLAEKFIKMNRAKVPPLINTGAHAKYLRSEKVYFGCSSKMELCREYKSQTKAKILLAIEGYGRLLGRGFGCCERIWKVKDAEYLRKISKKDFDLSLLR